MLRKRKKPTRAEKIAESRKGVKQKRREAEEKRKVAAKKLNRELNGGI